MIGDVTDRVARSATAGGADGGVETGDVIVRVTVDVVYGAEQA